MYNIQYKMDDIIHIGFESDSCTMSIDSRNSECRDRTSSIQSHCSLESDTSVAESKTDIEDDYKKSSQQMSKCIAIKQPMRSREMTMTKSLPKTPTPSKYYVMLQENENLVRAMKK
jgi:hypothetical protein